MANEEMPPVGVETITTEEVEPTVTVGTVALDQVADFLGRFCKFPNQACLDVVTLWVAHTYVVGANERLMFDSTPRLAFLSDKPASGKTRALEMCQLMAREPRIVIDPTPASYAISTHERRATMCIDEIDILFGAGGSKSVLRSLLNAGYKKRGGVWERANKEDMIIFAPLAMAGLGSKFRGTTALSTLASRTIMVNMRPRKGAEPYVPREHDRVAEAVRKDMANWVGHNAGPISEAWPELPEGIEDRLREVWEPLFMLAEIAGGHWPKSVWEAATELALGKSNAEEEIPISARLLADLRAAFNGEEKLSTVTIIDRLFEIDGSPWMSTWTNKASAPKELAAMLEPFGVAPVRIRDTEGHQTRGYKAEQFVGLWANLAPQAERPVSLDDPDEEG